MSSPYADRTSANTDAVGQVEQTDAASQSLQDEADQLRQSDPELYVLDRSSESNLPVLEIVDNASTGGRQPLDSEVQTIGIALNDPQFRRLVSDASGEITLNSLSDVRAMEKWVGHVDPGKQNPLGLTISQTESLKSLEECFYSFANGGETINPGIFAAALEPVEPESPGNVDEAGDDVDNSDSQPDSSTDSGQFGPQLKWDSNLDAMHVSVEHPQGLQPGDKYWKLVEARYRPPDEHPLDGSEEAQGRHHIFYQVLGENGEPLSGATVEQSWPDGATSATTGGDGFGNIPLWASGFGVETDHVDPNNPGEAGPYSASVRGYPSDVVHGMGLPYNFHVAYDLVYQLVTVPDTATDTVSDTAQSAEGAEGEIVAAADVAAPIESYYPDLDIRELKIWDNGYTEVTGQPHYTDDGGPNDPGAPQLASIFGEGHSRSLMENVGETQDFPKMTRMLRLNDPYNPNPDGSLPPTEVAVSAFGLATEVGEPVYLPKSSEYALDSSNRDLQGRVIYMDRASGEIVVAYHDGEFGDGYNIFVKGIEINDSLKLGERVDVSKQSLGTATGEEILVSMRDRHTFFDNRFIHHWWHNLTRHP